jgi:hypothetical protein
VRPLLAAISFSSGELQYLKQELDGMRQDASEGVDAAIAALERELAAYKSRLAVLTTAFANGDVERDIYLNTKESLLASRTRCRERLARLRTNPALGYDRAREALELAATALQSFDSGSHSQRRRILEAVSSNRTLSGSELSVELAFPFATMASSSCVQRMCIDQDTVRTFTRQRQRTKSSLTTILQTILIWMRVQHTAERAGQEPHPTYVQIGELLAPLSDKAA